MAKVNRGTSAVNARIVYWGADGAGKSTNLHAAYERLRPDHRGELREVPSRLDPTRSYELLPISLGEVAGIRTQIELVAAPGGADQAPMRKQLLDQVDGVVLVVDARPERTTQNLAAFEELRSVLADYGRRLSDIPFVVQYNKRDLVDPYALEDIHRKLNPGQAAVFEAVASTGSGVLQTLSTISKQVIRALREQNLALPTPEAAPAPPAPLPAQPLSPVASPAEPVAAAEAPASAADRMQAALEAEARQALPPQRDSAETVLDRVSPFAVPAEIEAGRGVRLGPDLIIVSVGEARRSGERSVQVPLVLGDAEGSTSTLLLTLQLDPLVASED